MSGTGSGGDDQSEDGELRHSPGEARAKQDILDFSLSEDDGDTADSLDIKPPQVQSSSRSSSSKSKRHERSHEERRHHNRSRHKDPDRVHSHRERHHREKHDLMRSRERESKYLDREYREHYRDRDRDQYREKELYAREVSYKESSKYLDLHYRSEKHEEVVLKYSHDVGTTSSSSSRGDDARYADAKKYSESERRVKDIERYLEKEKMRGRDRYDEEKDLRERLLDKHRIKEAQDEYRPDKQLQQHHSSRRKNKESSRYVEDVQMKEVVDLSGPEEFERKGRGRREEREEKVEISEAEREEQDLRRLKLLEAEREMARQKEQYRKDKERRHLQRKYLEARAYAINLVSRLERKRLAAEQDLEESKKARPDVNYPDKTISVVTVSDNSDSEAENNGENGVKSPASDGSRKGSSSDTSKDSDKSSERSNESGRRSRSRSKSRSRSRSPSRSLGPEEEEEEEAMEAEDAKEAAGKEDKAKNDEKSAKTQEDELAVLDTLPPYFPAIQGCRSVEEFQCLNKIEEGTYGVVYRARDKRTNEIVALKRLKMEKEKEGFPITSLREINTLLKGQHPNIVTVREIVVGSNMDRIFIVMDYVEHDLKSLMETMRHKKQVFLPGEVKCLLKQLLRAVEHLHDNWILHRDLKTSNLLLSHKGILKVGDFGLAREYGSPLKPYTPVVVTLWYRAPELLLGSKEYSTPIDMWSVGCIFAELVTMNALFPGTSDGNQLNRIFKDLGTPTEKVWPGYSKLPVVQKTVFTEYPVSNIRNKFNMLSELGKSLLGKFLTYDPVQRITAETALKHAYFTELPLPIDPAMFPTWPAKSELGHRKALAASPKPPSGGGVYKQLGEGDEDAAFGFHMGTNTGASLMETRRLAMGGGFSLKF